MAPSAPRLRSRSRFPMFPAGVSEARAAQMAAGFQHEIPDIIEFIVSDRYLARPLLYPRQATLLKIMFLQSELFTSYDMDVIEQWARSYEDTATKIDTESENISEGYNGIVPDVLERIAICKERGYPWFREVVAAIGRRGSKGHIGGIAGAYVLWNYLAFGDPQGHFGVDRDKKLSCFVFAGKKEQAKANQWADLKNIIRGGPCFAPFISQSLAERLTVFAPWDWFRRIELESNDIYSEDDIATFEIIPKESTLMAGRGPAAFCFMFDEMAHVVATGQTRSADDVYDSATPALDTFREYAFLYEPSSTWQKIGKFYVNYQRSLERENGKPVYPELLMVQLTSWDIYQDWELAHTLPLKPRSGIYLPFAA